MRLLIPLPVALVLVGFTVWAQDRTPARIEQAIKAAGVPITGMSFGSLTDKATWKVQPETLQGAAQPIINAFNPTDVAYEQAELDTQVKAALDNERLTAAVVWTILKQMYPTDSDAQTKTKFGVARTRIIDAYKSQPWKSSGNGRTPGD